MPRRVCRAAAALLLLAAPAGAQQFGMPPESDVVTLSGGFGFAQFSANEFVYSGGSTLSQLLWDSAWVPIATAEAKSRLDDGWHVAVAGAVGAGGDGFMTDYDWIAPHATGNGPDDWSHRSLHPDTRLDHYFSAGLRVGKDLLRTAGVRGGFHVEANYTDAQWTAYGGSYIYSVGGFRDTVGTIADGTAGVTYRQSFPMLLAGADAELDMGDMRFSGAVQGGYTFFASSVDDHWLRDLRYTDRFNAAPVLAAEARAAFDISDNANFFAAVAAKKIFTAVGDTTIENTNTGTTNFYAGAAGADFMSTTVSAGVGGRF